MKNSAGDISSRSHIAKNIFIDREISFAIILSMYSLDWPSSLLTFSGENCLTAKNSAILFPIKDSCILGTSNTQLIFNVRKKSQRRSIPFPMRKYSKVIYQTVLVYKHTLKRATGSDKSHSVHCERKC